MAKGGRKSRQMSRSNGDAELDVSFLVDAAALAELEQLVGEAVVHIVVWEDSIVDAFGDSDFTDAAADIDIYLEDGVRFELYAVLCYTDIDGEPIAEVNELGMRFDSLISEGLHLTDVAADTEDNLVLVLSTRESTVYVNAGAWTADEWEELPT
jgi:hypothetical protein